MTKDATTIVRFRGDTYPVRFHCEQDDEDFDISGCSFSLTVNALRNPTGTDAPEFALTGTIVDAAGGIVHFEPSAAQADQTPGRFWYDVQMTDASARILTIAKGEWIVEQDVTK